MPNGQPFNTGTSSGTSQSSGITMPDIPTITTSGVSSVTQSAASAGSKVAGLSGANYSGVDTTTLRGIMAASGPTYNLTVNGAFDKEGTARTIVDTLNNSYYRGTGGAGSLVTP